MTYPTFNNGDTLPASDLNAIGLWLVKSQAVGSGVSSVTVTGAFSADYDNYLVTYTGGLQSVDTATTFQLGSATTGYYGTFIYGQYTGGSVLQAALNNSSNFLYAGGGGNCFMSITVLCPFLACPTRVQSLAGYQTTYGTFTGFQDSATQFTSLTISAFSGTLTGGTVRVYGYRK
jgi:hypothetical protein